MDDGFKGLRLYNTLTGRKEDFVPFDPGNVRMYVCGPTVYDFAHIGNARPVIVFDVLFRLLRHLYGADHVTYVRNITDVDDKIIQRAAEEHSELPLNEAIRRVTETTEKQFHEDVAALGCLTREQVNKPDQPPRFIEPRATEHVGDMIDMIRMLVDEGYAYPEQGHVLFDVRSWKAADGSLEYGKLSKRTLDDMIAGARVEVAPYKRDPMDFVLWKPSKAGEPMWDSPWGKGRPGWHIECSAMARKHLGETFDIHGGGIDLVFPHHENEIAQSRCANHTELMAKYWLHNGFLQVEGRKMAKSEGNFVTIRAALDDWGGYAWPGEAIRFNMLRTHYRQPIDWTYAALDEAHSILWDWYSELTDVAARPADLSELLDALNDDINTPAAIATLHDLRRRGARVALLTGLRLLGLSGKRNFIRRVPRIDSGGAAGMVEAMLSSLTGAAREHAIQDFVSSRAIARESMDYATADRIRAELDAMGIQLKDAKDPKTGELVTTWEVKR